MSDLPQSSIDLQRIYRERFGGSLQYRTEVWKELVGTVFAALVPPDSAVLDLGCGYGEFLNHIEARVKFGMDLNPDAARNAGPNVRILQHDCSAPWPILEASLDVVFTSNFFEHLPSKEHLQETLRHAFRALKPGGKLIAMGPNIKYLGGAYWDFYDHHLPLTESSLAEGLRNAGFFPERVTACFLPYTMSDRKQYPLWLLRLYLRLPVLWPLFGKQFLIVARRLG